MKKFFLFLFLILLIGYQGQTCTNLIVTKGASADSSTMLVYTNDGYIKDEDGSPKQEGYPEDWTKSVIEADSEKYKIPDWNNENAIEVLPY